MVSYGQEWIQKRQRSETSFILKKELESFSEFLHKYASSDEGQMACQEEWNLCWQGEDFFDLKGMKNLLKSWQQEL
jgi:hypothetical protein